MLFKYQAVRNSQSQDSLYTRMLYADRRDLCLLFHRADSSHSACFAERNSVVDKNLFHRVSRLRQRIAMSYSVGCS